jgi:hypothetical protein
MSIYAANEIFLLKSTLSYPVRSLNKIPAQGTGIGLGIIIVWQAGLIKRRDALHTPIKYSAVYLDYKK